MGGAHVSARALEQKYGLHSPGQQVWNVSPVWHIGEVQQLFTLDNAGAAGNYVRAVQRIYDAATMQELEEALQVVEQHMLWDAPDIRVTNREDLRLATYIFHQFIAQPRLIPLVVMVSQPALDCHLIDLDAGLVTTPHKSWLLPMGWFLPKQIISNIHMKIGVKGGLKRGKIELMVCRFTNLPPIPPWGWQRSLVGFLLGAWPHACEGLLGRLFDWAEGGNYSSGQKFGQLKCVLQLWQKRSGKR